jgi:hypothetical protein
MVETREWAISTTGVDAHRTQRIADFGELMDDGLLTAEVFTDHPGWYAGEDGGPGSERRAQASRCAVLMQSVQSDDKSGSQGQSDPARVAFDGAQVMDFTCSKRCQ